MRAPACNYLGIYPQQIEDAADTFELVCEMYGLDVDKEWAIVDQKFQERYGDEFGDSVVSLMFWNLKSALVEKGVDESRVDFYVNGTLDTSFYIDGEEIA